MQNSVLSMVVGISMLILLVSEAASNTPRTMKVITSAPKLLQLLNDLQNLFLILGLGQMASTCIACEHLLTATHAANRSVWQSKLTTLRHNAKSIMTITVDNGKGKSIFFCRLLYYDLAKILFIFQSLMYFCSLLQDYLKVRESRLSC